MQSPELFACLSKERKENLLGTLHTIQGYLGEISISEMLDAYVNWLNGADPTQYD